MNKTKNTGKNRKRRFTADLHIKKNFVHACLSKDLRKQLKRRSLGLRKNDTVKIMVGKHKKKTAKVNKIDLKKERIYLQGLNLKKADGKEKLLGFEPSNLMIIEIGDNDALRIKTKKEGNKK